MPLRRAVYKHQRRSLFSSHLDLLPIFLLRALAALSKTKDVDVKGGWKVSEPYVDHPISLVQLPAYFCTSVPYTALAQTFSMIEATTKRLEKNALLTSLLLLVIQRSSKKDHTSLLQTVYLCINRVSLLPYNNFPYSRYRS